MRPEWRGRWASCTGAGRSSIALPKPCSACCWPPAKPKSYPADLWGGPPGPRGSPWTRPLLHVVRLLAPFCASRSRLACPVPPAGCAPAPRRYRYWPPERTGPRRAPPSVSHRCPSAPVGAHPPGSRDSAVKPTAAPDPACPPRPRRLGAQGRHHRLQVFVGGPEAPLVLLGEVILIVGGVIELVLVFDVHGARVAGFRQNREEAFPIHCPLAGDAKAPPPGIVQRIDAGAAQHMPQDFAVLEVHVVD